MSGQNPFKRSNNDCYCNNCQNDCQNNCNGQQPRCDDCDDCHDKDRNPCVVCPQGPAGGVLGYADFYALMPPDNSATVASGTNVSFPRRCYRGRSADSNLKRSRFGIYCRRACHRNFTDCGHGYSNHHRGQLYSNSTQSHRKCNCTHHHASLRRNSPCICASCNHTDRITPL